MERLSSHSEAVQTEYRLLKPMPSRSDSSRTQGFTENGVEPWDSQVGRLFPPRDTSPAELPSVSGIRLGHFEIEERIARGGMGTVFRARDTRLDRVVALKVLSRDQLREQAAIQRFRNEARAAAKLDHENIARVYFVGEDRGVHFIAFEYVRGTTVREAIALKGRLTPDEAVNYTLQTAEALKHTDLAGVVHRDIKPSNLIVTPSGRVKLVDLGLARNIDPASDDDLTVTGTTLGTFDYISPEQARDPRSVDVRSDIYSLGCTLFQMLTGSPPYPDGTTVDKLVQHSTGRPPDPAERNPRISPRLSLVVQRMMAPNPDERYPSPQALIDDLAQIAEGLGLRATAPEGTIWRKPLYRSGSPRWEENRGWILAFGIIALLAVAGDDVYSWVTAVRRDWNRSREELQGVAEIASQDPLQRAEDRPSTQVADVSPQTNSGTSTTAGPVGGSVVPAPNPSANRIPVVEAASGSKLLENVVGATALAAAAAERESTQELAAATSPSAASVSGVSTPPAVVATADAGASSSIGASVPTVSPAVAEQPFIVHGPDGSESRYQTLEAACHEAKDGSVIDIDYDGPLPRPQKPLAIHNKQLTIRPVEGKRPQLQFVPGESLRAQSEIRLIDVRDGSLDLYDLDLHVDVSRDVYAERWVFLSLTRTEDVELKRVTMTVENPGQRPAVMIERGVPVSEPAPMMPAVDPQWEGTVSLQDCLFRGAATFFADRTREPGTVRMEKVAVGIPGDFLHVLGAEPAEMDGLNRTSPGLRFELDHVTAVAQTMLHLESGDSRQLPQVFVNCRNSVLEAGIVGPGPLLVLEGHQDSEALLQHVAWSGNWNVLMCDLEAACVVRGWYPLGGDEVIYSLADWAGWQSNWDPSQDNYVEQSVLTMREKAGFDFAELESSDFALRPEAADEARNPAMGSANDNTDRGFPLSTSDLRARLGLD
jgi:serine/threonine-protein kinase